MGGTTVSDAWYHPTERFTATGILAESSNVGTLKIAQKLGPHDLGPATSRRFGVGSKTGIELPGESGGYLPPLSTVVGLDVREPADRPGRGMTALQLASMYQTIANNGVRVPPRIVESSTDARTAPRRPPSSPRASG